MRPTSSQQEGSQEAGLDSLRSSASLLLEITPSSKALLGRVSWGPNVQGLFWVASPCSPWKAMRATNQAERNKEKSVGHNYCCFLFGLSGHLANTDTPRQIKIPGVGFLSGVTSGLCLASKADSYCGVKLHLTSRQTPGPHSKPTGSCMFQWGRGALHLSLPGKETRYGWRLLDTYWAALRSHLLCPRTFSLACCAEVVCPSILTLPYTEFSLLMALGKNNFFVGKGEEEWVYSLSFCPGWPWACVAKDDLEFLSLLPLHAKCIYLFIWCWGLDPGIGPMHAKQALCQPTYIPGPRPQYSMKKLSLATSENLRHHSANWFVNKATSDWGSG